MTARSGDIEAAIAQHTAMLRDIRHDGHPALAEAVQALIRSLECVLDAARQTKAMLGREH